MSIVGQFVGKFIENKACKNEQYFQSIWVFPVEAYGNIIEPNNMSKPVTHKILCDNKVDGQLINLTPNKQYKLLCSIGVNKANTKDGVTYPASVNLNVLKVSE